MLQPPTPRRATAPSGGAFTLMEVLIAMSIFTVGAIAVAAIFPVGVLLQRETINASLSAHVSDGTVAMIEARGFRFANTWYDEAAGDNNIPGHGESAASGTPAETRTYPIPDKDLSAPSTEVAYGLRGWALADRGYPSIEADAAKRQFYWVPLAYDINDGPSDVSNGGMTNRKWMVFVFILRREDNVDYGALGKRYPDAATDGEGAANAADEAAQSRRIPGLAWVGVDNAATNSYVVTTLTSAVSSGDDEFKFDNASPVTGFLRVNVGDPILDQFGSIYEVIAADEDGVTVDREIAPKAFTNRRPDGFWYAPGSAAKRIEVLVDSDANNVVWE